MSDDKIVPIQPDPFPLSSHPTIRIEALEQRCVDLQSRLGSYRSLIERNPTHDVAVEDCEHGLNAATAICPICTETHLRAVQHSYFQERKRADALQSRLDAMEIRHPTDVCDCRFDFTDAVMTVRHECDYHKRLSDRLDEIRTRAEGVTRGRNLAEYAAGRADFADEILDLFPAPSAPSETTLGQIPPPCPTCGSRATFCTRADCPSAPSEGEKR